MYSYLSLTLCPDTRRVEAIFVYSNNAIHFTPLKTTLCYISMVRIIECESLTRMTRHHNARYQMYDSTPHAAEYQISSAQCGKQVNPKFYFTVSRCFGRARCSCACGISISFLLAFCFICPCHFCKEPSSERGMRLRHNGWFTESYSSEFTVAKTPPGLDPPRCRIRITSKAWRTRKLCYISKAGPHSWTAPETEISYCSEETDLPVQGFHSILKSITWLRITQQTNDHYHTSSTT